MQIQKIFRNPLKGSVNIPSITGGVLIKTHIWKKVFAN